MEKYRLLFLDFDGVLHDVDAPQIEYEGRGLTITGAGLFRHAPRLAALLAAYPDVRVVISSSWSMHFSVDELKARLGTLGALVIGTTQDLAHESRYAACEEMSLQLDAIDWRMLDDQVSIVFGNEEPPPWALQRVLFCDPVLALSTPGVWDRLTNWLADGLTLKDREDGAFR